MLLEGQISLKTPRNACFLLLLTRLGPLRRLLPGLGCSLPAEERLAAPGWFRLFLVGLGSVYGEVAVWKVSRTSVGFSPYGSVAEHVKDCCHMTLVPNILGNQWDEIR